MSEKTEKTLTREEALAGCRAYKKAWREKHPEKQAIYTARYIQKKAEAIAAKMLEEKRHE